jgi:CheY-like chemotaxis protein
VADGEVISMREHLEKLREAKIKAEDASVIKDKFVSMVAHDLRSPFTSIIGLLNLVIKDAKHPLHEEHRATIGRVLKSSNEMLTMIDELLNLGRLRTGAIKLRPGFFNGRSLVARVLDNLQPMADQKGVALENKVPVELRLCGDRNLYREVLHNLVTNSIKFSHPGGVIRLFAPNGHRSTIAVEDNGVGIRLERMTKLFNNEDRNSTIGTAGERGTGLGLPFANDIMALHGGTISVRSEEGKGSTFMATLPFQKPRIHFVDDDEYLHQLIADFLDPLDVELEFSRDGKAGIEAMLSNAPHVVITDIQMPIMGGFELLGKMRQMDEFRSLPVIMVTSDSDMRVRELAFQHGANDFISKPLLREDLVPRLNRFLC